MPDAILSPKLFSIWILPFQMRDLVISPRSQGQRQKSGPGNALQSPHLSTLNWLKKNAENVGIELTVIRPRQQGGPGAHITFFLHKARIENYVPLHKLLWLLLNSIIFYKNSITVQEICNCGQEQLQVVWVLKFLHGGGLLKKKNSKLEYKIRYESEYVFS